MKTIATYIMVALVMQPFFLLYCQNNTNDIIKAYELRMDGRTEEAIEVLSEIIESDPENAMAHFEMARSLENDKKIQHINKALEYDPENLAYKFYKANLQMLEAYKGIKSNNKELISDNLDSCTETLKSILAIKPDCKESLMFLIDIYGVLPEDIGGDVDMAKTYLESLKKVDPLYAAHGELILKFKEGEVDMVEYWKNYMATHGESDKALIKLGNAYLMSNDIEKGKECFNTVIKKDPEQAILHLNVARANLYAAMGGGDQSNEALKRFKENIQRYLDSEVKKPKLIEAWCYGWLGMVENKLGNKKIADKYVGKAEKLIPNYPRFTAVPNIDLPPNVVAYQYKSYFTPFY